METEIKRRLNILNEIKIPRVTAQSLRGGMQERLHRRESINNRRNIENQKRKLNKRLSLIEQERESENLGMFQSSSVEPLDEFNEPIFRRIRNRRGFF